MWSLDKLTAQFVLTHHLYPFIRGYFHLSKIFLPGSLILILYRYPKYLISYIMSIYAPHFSKSFREFSLPLSLNLRLLASYTLKLSLYFSRIILKNRFHILTEVIIIAYHLCDSDISMSIKFHSKHS